MLPMRPLCGPFPRLSAPLTPPSASQMVLPPPVKFQRESAVLDTLSGDALAGSKNSRTEALQRATQRKPAVPWPAGPAAPSPVDTMVRTPGAEGTQKPRGPILTHATDGSPLFSGS